ncbi:MAG: HAMP domain-containing histidine kinase [Anaerolineae bacterium]|uniref:sensor histidine kinase n=1 Tax=Candidatus Flexifilum breve TaxID=3140694 RepID=UPI001AC41172|nr:HAMP domain-containing histidine kinase [Chloroflexota bacterium]MBN8634958.1 HAMP domain-containing histidine kinase [Anaerolineae bacterium]
MPESSWTEVVGVIAHDLKTPITSVKGYLELIEQVGELNERQQQFSERALNSLKHMEQLVGLLLELSWIDADRPLQCDDCDVAALLTRVVSVLEDMAARREVTCHLEIEPHLGVIPAEGRRLEQAILNLVNNAIKYNRQGGNVWVTAKKSESHVHLTIRDTGVGIAPEDQPYIFDRFYRVRSHSHEHIEGTGLGLSIVKAVIEKHGGTITLESALGEGTTFFVTLPRARGASCE